jgi:hypothetical protein
MFTFLRKIRRSLIESGAAQKYLLYAIGEIALVVIGILIALQINNWNEWRKDRIMERALLIQLHEEFTTNKARLDSTVSRNREIVQKLTKLIELFPINAKTLNNETLKDCQSWLHGAGIIATFEPSNSIINALTNNNSFELITDNALRKEVLNWHSVLDDYVEEERKNTKHSLEQIQPYLDRRMASDLGLFDKRLDISFLGTLEFEGLIRRKKGRLTRIYGLTNDTSSPDLKMLHNSIENIIRLTQPK